ncbi:flagellar hook-basal body complex protein FliE [Erythrobacter cryptus]|uniref:flagellar hook-basal body complex protein FliE n=1 Tax=Erythrobacter cryptus TaxID=196588 RepID=UPI0003FDDC5D|nr:flagellar hook-basal body complex protein FliE [Erythrobacter cryptus]GIX19931.1 MAG: hypothetical protein KatS3mg120_1607 [Erythrobacter sp.]
MSSTPLSFGVAEIMALRSEIVGRSSALQALRAARAGAPGAAPAAPLAPPGAGFAATLETALRQVSAVQERSSQMQAAYERGAVTDIAEVMLARQEASIAFEATLQVRNKLLSAYQDIMRMGG